MWCMCMYQVNYIIRRYRITPHPTPHFIPNPNLPYTSSHTLHTIPYIHLTPTPHPIQSHTLHPHPTPTQHATLHPTPPRNASYIVYRACSRYPFANLQVTYDDVDGGGGNDGLLIMIFDIDRGPSGCRDGGNDYDDDDRYDSSR